MKKMFKVLIVLPLMSCSSINNQKRIVSYKTIQKVRLGFDEKSVEKILGQPKEKIKKSDFIVWVYVYPYGGLDLPHANVYFSNNSKVKSLSYNVLEPVDGELSLKNISLNTESFEQSTPEYNGMHSLPAEKYLTDHTKGIKIAYRPDYGDKVDSIAWFETARFAKE